MYRILLVDDEPLILAGIASMMNWEDYNCTVVGKATNGNQALEKMKEIQPDIVITDIKMPAMNGLDFMEKCREQGYQAEFLLLTNLEEFSLAQKALRLGALDYLVKIEITPEVLGESLKKAVSVCREKKDMENHAVVQEVLQKNAEETTKAFFTEIMEKRKDECGELQKKWRADVESLGLEELYVNPVLWWIRPYKQEEHIFQKTEESAQKETMEYASSLLKQFMDRISDVYCMINWERKGFVVIFPKEKMPGNIKNAGRKILHIFRDYFGMHALVAVSKPADDIWEGIRTAVGEIRAMEEYYYYHSQDSVLYAGDFDRKELQDRHSRHNVFDISFLKKDLKQALMVQDRQKVEQVFSEVAELFSEYKPAKEQVVDACMNLYYFFFDYAQGGKKEEKKVFPYPSEIVERLGQCFTLEENVSWLKELGQWISSTMETLEGGSKTEQLVNAAKKYVQKNYKEKLTLAMISGDIGISQGYLSSVFKKTTGSNLNDYVNQVKIEKAKDLLGLHEYMMYEISDMLGFENPYYFSKVFKRITGMTPSDYETMRKR